MSESLSPGLRLPADGLLSRTDAVGSVTLGFVRTDRPAPGLLILMRVVLTLMALSSVMSLASARAAVPRLIGGLSVSQEIFDGDCEAFPASCPNTKIAVIDLATKAQTLLPTC